MKEKVDKYRKLLRDVAIKYVVEPNHSLYHYTGYGSGLAILKSQNLRKTEYRSLKDRARTEILTGFEAIVDLVELECDKHKKNKFLHNFWNTVLRNLLLLYPKDSKIKESYMKKIKRFKIGHIDLKPSYFILSFCKLGDYAYAWDEFAQKNTGICISFKPKYFKAQNYSNEEIRNSEVISVNIDVIYHEAEFKSNISEFLAATNQFIKTERLISNDLDELYVSLWGQLLGYVPGLLVYESELEFRQYEYEFIHKGIHYPRDLSARKENKESRSYLNTLSAFNYKDIEAIWIGPKCIATAEEIRNKLRSYGELYPNTDSIPIIKSKIII